MNINFAIISGILLIYSAFVIPKLKLPVIILRWTKLLENFRNFDNTLLNHCDDNIVSILLYGSSKYSFSTNNQILSLTVEFLESTKRFHKPHFWIASTLHRGLTPFQRPWDVYGLSATSCERQIDLRTTSYVQLAAVHG